MKQLHRLFIFSIGIYFSMTALYGQEDEKNDDPFTHTIDSAAAISPAYMPVSFTDCGKLFFKPIDYKEIDTTMSLIGQYDPLNQTQNIYQSLGTYGQAHQPINFSFKKEAGFSLFTNSYPLYYKEQEDLKYYKLKTSYTNLAFTYGIATENTFYATHAQNIKDQATIAVNLRGYNNDGYFTHQRSSNIVFDALVNYEIPSQIYGFRFGYIVNYFNLEENGGLVNANDYISQTVNNLQGYNMKLYNATSKLLTNDLLFQQYVNFKSKVNKKGKNNYWGTLMHTFQFKQQRSSYLDINPDSAYYQNIFFFASDSTLDTLQFYTFSNTIQWSSFQPFKENKNEKYFLRFSGGVTYEYTHSAKSNYIGHAMIPFAQMHTRLFSVIDIQAKIYYTLGGYQQNDLNANAEISWAINRENRHFIGANIDFYYLSPDYYLTRFVSNHHFWHNSWSKQNVLRFSSFWKRKGYVAEFNYFMLHNYVILNKDLTPLLLDKYTNIFQLHLFAPFYMKGFGLTTNMYLQYSNAKEIQVPIFAGKADIFYRFNIFKNKAKLQFGFNMAYNTNYYAAAYYPLMRQFHYQDSNKVGNYFYLDTYIAIQVQRINIFFKVNHVLSGLMGHDYFTTPDYPMQNRKFNIGITWKFYD
ncbi:MAG TPA: hypothetical protein PK740_06025 [Bacteroidales bacterium]|nr:hypothetical protein [Bacteroidales bacterium]